MIVAVLFGVLSCQFSSIQQVPSGRTSLSCPLNRLKLVKWEQMLNNFRLIMRRAVSLPQSRWRFVIFFDGISLIFVCHCHQPNRLHLSLTNYCVHSPRRCCCLLLSSLVLLIETSSPWRMEIRQDK